MSKDTKPDLVDEIDDLLNEIDGALDASRELASNDLEEHNEDDGASDRYKAPEEPVESSETLWDETAEDPEVVSTNVEAMQEFLEEEQYHEDENLAGDNEETYDDEYQDFENEYHNEEAIEEASLSRTQWRVVRSYDDEGIPLRGKAAREDPGVMEFVFESEDGTSIVRSVLMSPRVATEMHTSLGKLVESYQDKPRPTVKSVGVSTWTRIKDWHKHHKVLAGANFIFLAVLGVSLLFTLIQGARTL